MPEFITTVPESEGNNGMENEMECRKRHDILSRRPSYRKILNDLSSGAPGVAKIEEENENETVNSITSLANSQGHSMQNYHTVNAGQQSTQTLQLVSEGLQQQGGLHTITMSNAGAQGAVVQLAQSQDGQQYFVPVNASDLQSYPIKLSGALPQGVVVAQQGNVPTQQQLAEEATRKRELRLMKNRIAAKECRGKKKEYVKCLENRVAVLENQNKALIEELKALKDLYCHKSE